MSTKAHNLPTWLTILMIAIPLVVACDPTPGTPTPPPTAQSTPSTLTPPDATTTPRVDQSSIEDLIATMEHDVIAGDKNAYLSHVALTDSIFALEHTRLADGWVKRPPVSFKLNVRDLTITGSSAVGTLTISWKMASEEEGRIATLPVRFTHATDGNWRFAGEDWVSFDTGGQFKVRVLPGLENIARELIPELPEVYDHITSSFGYKPTRNPEIKLYDTSENLVAMTLLDQPDILGWNEPGEALKFVAEEYYSGLKGGISHEFTHYLTFDMAGTAHTRMPWWLEEGLAVYAGSHFDLPEDTEGRMNKVRVWAAEGSLADWDSISDFETTPLDKWQYVYSQGYAMVRYITEKYGKDQRNRWVTAMSTSKDLKLEIKQATTEVLGLPFEELDRAFVAWLKQQ